jgi:hypothetical protein
MIPNLIILGWDENVITGLFMNESVTILIVVDDYVW